MIKSAVQALVKLFKLFIAFWIDFGIVVAILTLIILTVPGMRDSSRPCTAVYGCVSPTENILIPGLLIAFYLYPLIFERLAGGTVGKLMLGFRVRNQDGSPLSWADAMLRSWTHPIQFMLNLIPISWGLDLFAWIVSDKAQFYVDACTRTKVVSSKQSIAEGRSELGHSSEFLGNPLFTLRALCIVVSITLFGFFMLAAVEEGDYLTGFLASTVHSIIFSSVTFLLNKLRRPLRIVSMDSLDSGSTIAPKKGRSFALLPLLRSKWTYGVLAVSLGITIFANWSAIDSRISYMIKDPSLIRSLDGQGSPIENLAFSPDGNLLAGGGVDRAVRIWDVSSGELVHIVESEELGEFKEYLQTSMIPVAFSNDGGTLAVGGGDNSVRILDSSRWEPVAKLDNNVLADYSGEMVGIHALAFSTDGLLLAVGTEDRRYAGGPGKIVVVWDVANQEPASIFRWSESDHEGTKPSYNYISSLSFSGNSTMLAASANDGTLRIWDMRTGDLRLDLVDNVMGQPEYIMSPLPNRKANLRVQFPSEGNMLAISGMSRRVWFLYMGLGNIKESDAQHRNNSPSSLSFTFDGKILASGSWDGSVMLWRSADQGLLERIIMEGNAFSREVGVKTLAFSPDGKILAIATGDGRIGLWDIPTRVR